jgi:hypothetical protein
VVDETNLDQVIADQKKDIKIRENIKKLLYAKEDINNLK